VRNWLELLMDAAVIAAFVVFGTLLIWAAMI